MSSWYDPNYPINTIAVSTRIRLARNIKGIPFPTKMTPEQFNAVNDMVRNAIKKSELPIAKRL